MKEGEHEDPSRSCLARGCGRPHLHRDSNPRDGRRKMLRLEVVLALILSFIGLGAAVLFSGLLTG
jgi:hypothetical protein